MSYTYIDHLQEYMKGLVKRTLARDENFPVEFKGVPDDKLVALIADHATSVLRKVEDDAVCAAIERTASLIRYSLMNKK